MNYLFSKRIDLLGIYLPFTLLWISFLFTPSSIIYTSFPAWAWLIFVVGFDVSHVWSTLFRTYLDKEGYQNHKSFLTFGPPIFFILSFLLAYISIAWFWRILAYVAVFHFIKQQYGFLALYRVRKGLKLSAFSKNLDKLVIYTATGSPILIWHFNPSSAFHWFVAGDFFSLNILTSVYQNIKWIASVIFILIFCYWIFHNFKNKYFSLGALLWVGFTVLNWFGAIVFINSDYIFTVSNVVAHGLPYLILIIYYKSKNKKSNKTVKRNTFLKWSFAILFTVFSLAIIEEFFWDKLVNHERENIFGTAQIIAQPMDINASTLALFTAILALPQIWHYFVDGLIWKANKKNPKLKILFKNE